METRETTRGRVLVVDDDPDTRWMTAEALRNDYDVVAAASPGEALTRARDQAPDAVAVDLTLGGESGWELIRALQGDPDLRTVPVIVLSASTTVPPPGIEPCAAYLTKPCPLSQLREVLARLLGPPQAGATP